MLRRWALEVSLTCGHEADKSGQARGSITSSKHNGAAARCCHAVTASVDRQWVRLRDGRTHTHDVHCHLQHSQLIRSRRSGTAKDRHRPTMPPQCAQVANLAAHSRKFALRASSASCVAGTMIGAPSCAKAWHWSTYGRSLS